MNYLDKDPEFVQAADTIHHLLGQAYSSRNPEFVAELRKWIVDLSTVAPKLLMIENGLRVAQQESERLGN